MDRKRLIEIFDENLGATDEWGCNVLIDGIAAAADAILEAASQSCTITVDSADAIKPCSNCGSIREAFEKHCAACWEEK